MSASALQSRFLAILKTEKEDNELQLSSYSEQRLEHMISIGIERMVLAKAIEKKEKLGLAEENIKNLVEYLSGQAKHYGSYPHMEDLAFDMAIAECYPIWPFV